MGSESPELDDWEFMCIGFVITVIICILIIVIICIILSTRHRNSAQGRDLDAELHEDLDRYHLDREIFDAERFQRNEGDLESFAERLRLTIQVSCGDEDEDEVVPVQCEVETSEDASSDDSELSFPRSLHSDGGSMRWDSDFDACQDACKYSDGWTDSQSSSSSGLESEFSSPCPISSGRESSDSAISSAEEDLLVSDQSDNEEQQCSDMNHIAKVEAETNNSANFQSEDSNSVPSLTNSLSNDSFQSPQSPPLSDLFRSDSNQSMTDHLSEVLSQNSNQSSTINNPLHEHSDQCPKMANPYDEESPPATLPHIDGCNQIKSMTTTFSPDSIQSPCLTDLLHSNLSQTLPLTDFLNHDSSQGPTLPATPNDNPHGNTRNLSLSDPLNNDSNQSPTLTDRLHEALNQNSAITILNDDTNQSSTLNDPLQNGSKQHPTLANPSNDENPPVVSASNDNLNRNQPLTNPLKHNSSQSPYFADLLHYDDSNHDSNHDSILTNTFSNSNQRSRNPSFTDLFSDDSRQCLSLSDSHNGSNQSSCSPTLTVPLANLESPLTEPLDDGPHQIPTLDGPSHISDQISIITESFHDDSSQGSTVTEPFNDDLHQDPQSSFLSDSLNDDTSN